jgi:hypothetical protein
LQRESGTAGLGRRVAVPPCRLRAPACLPLADDRVAGVVDGDAE